MKAFKNASIYVEGEGLVKTSISFDKTVLNIGSDATDEADVIELPEGALVLPAFIDVHVHGAAGADAMDASDEAITKIAGALAKEGTAAFLATTMTQSEENVKAALSAAREYHAADKKAGAELLGVHLEGPFISEKYCGAQPKEYIKELSISLFDEFQSESGELIKIATVAPEKEGAGEFVGHIAKTAVVSIGHSEAKEADVRAAIAAGATSVTHTYNAQSGVHHRDIGVAGSALLYDELFCEFIADGIHISVPAMKLLIKNKPNDKLVLITDAIRAKGLGDGISELGGQKVTVRGGEARLDNGALAGSVLTMNKAVKNLVELCGADVCYAADAASANPAKLLGIYDERGSIAAGKRADFSVLDNEFNVLLTIRDGEIIYKA